jgi:hypothetical protein
MPDGILFVTEESSTYSSQKTLQAGKVHSRLACIDDDENKEKIQEEEPLISLPIRTNSTRTGFLDSVRDEIPKDDVFSKIFEKIKDQMRKPEDFDEGKSSTYQSYRLDPNSNLLYLIERTGSDRLCVPKKLRKEILSYAHDNNAHGGVHRTYDFLRRSCVLHRYEKTGNGVRNFLPILSGIERIKPKAVWEADDKALENILPDEENPMVESYRKLLTFYRDSHIRRKGQGEWEQQAPPSTTGTLPNPSVRPWGAELRTRIEMADLLG